MNEGYTPELDKSKMDKSFAVQPSDTIGFLAMLAPNINEEELAKNIQLVIDNVRELFHNDEMAERVLREPLFARRVLEGEPISAYALFDAVREVGKGDPAIAAEMVTHLHAKGAMRTVFNASGAVRFIGESEEEKERMRLDRMLYIALNKAGFREGELVKESMDEVMVARAIRYANELRASCGLDPIGLQEEDYRLMSEGALGIDTNGAAEIGEEEVHATKARSPLSQLRTIVHESVHFASDTSITN